MVKVLLQLAIVGATTAQLFSGTARPDSVRPEAVQRPRAIEYSDWYGRRATLHRIGSYTILPLFVAEYALGNRLLSGGPDPSWVRSAHGAVAGGIGAVFALNTVTGVWNLWDSRQDPNGRGLRITHAVLMLASDAGFLATGLLAPESEEDEGGGVSNFHHNAIVHRNVALGSMALSAAGTLLMWIRHD